MLSTVCWSQIRHVKLTTTLQRGRRTISVFITPSHIGVHVRGSRGLHAALRGEQRSEDLDNNSVDAEARRTHRPTDGVFEELTDEYTKQAKLSLNNVESRPAQTPEGHVNQVLARLISKGDFEGAQGAKRELLNAGALLGNNSIYVQAALHSLERRADTTHGKLFLEWWSLVPDEAMQQHISPVATSLMQQPMQLDLVTEFSLLCAKAGHANEVGAQLLPFIFRYLDEASTLRFVQSFHDQAPRESMSSRSHLLNLAVRLNFIAERRVEGFRLLELIHKEGLSVDRATTRAISRNHIDETQRQFSQPRVVLPKVPTGQIRFTPPPSTMADHLKLLRQAVKSVYTGNLASFAAFFIMTYEDRYKRTRAVQILRKRVFSNGSLPVQSAWVAAEQLTYIRRKLPVPVIRSFLHYCLPAHVPVKTLRELLLCVEERIQTSGKGRKFDKESSKSELVPVKSKFWPNVASLSAVWKAAIQLSSSRKELDDLYSAMLQPLQKQCAEAEADPAELLGRHVRTSVPIAELPDAVVFHHFITAFATRYGGQHGANVLVDMTRLGVKQSMQNWTSLVGVYARSADVERVNDILSFLETLFRGSVNSKIVDEATFRENMLVAYNSVIRGYTECNMHEGARTVQKRMDNLGYFTDGVAKRTRFILDRLSKSEEGKFDERKERKRRRFKVVNGRKLYVDPGRVDWIH